MFNPTPEVIKDQEFDSFQKDMIHDGTPHTKLPLPDTSLTPVTAGAGTSFREDSLGNPKKVRF